MTTVAVLWSFNNNVQKPGWAPTLFQICKNILQIFTTRFCNKQLFYTQVKLISMNIIMITIKQLSNIAKYKYGRNTSSADKVVFIGFKVFSFISIISCLFFYTLFIFLFLYNEFWRFESTTSCSRGWGFLSIITKVYCEGYSLQQVIGLYTTQL